MPWVDEVKENEEGPAGMQANLKFSLAPFLFVLKTEIRFVHEAASIRNTSSAREKTKQGSIVASAAEKSTQRGYSTPGAIQLCEKKQLTQGSEVLYKIREAIVQVSVLEPGGDVDPAVKGDGSVTRLQRLAMALSNRALTSARSTVWGWLWHRRGGEGC